MVVISNEILDEKFCSKDEGMVFKIGFEEVCDHIDWGFMYDTYFE